MIRQGLGLRFEMIIAIISEAELGVSTSSLSRSPVCAMAWPVEVILAPTETSYSGEVFIYAPRKTSVNLPIL